MGEGAGGGQVDGPGGQGERVAVPVHAGNGGARPARRTRGRTPGPAGPAAVSSTWPRPTSATRAGGHLGTEGQRPAAGPPGTRRAPACPPRPPAPIRSRSATSHGWSASSWTPMGPPMTTRPAIESLDRGAARRGRAGRPRPGARRRPRASAMSPGPSWATCWTTTHRSIDPTTPGDGGPATSRSPPRGRPRPDCPSGRPAARAVPDIQRAQQARRGGRRRRPGSGGTGGRPACGRRLGGVDDPVGAVGGHDPQLGHGVGLEAPPRAARGRRTDCGRRGRRRRWPPRRRPGGRGGWRRCAPSCARATG